MDRPVRIIGAPTDYGTNRRGVDMGPSAIRYAGLAAAVESTGAACNDDGDLAATRAEELPDELSEEFAGKARFLEECKDVTGRLAERVTETIADGSFPLVLGGDHSIAIGTIRGSSRDADLGVVWFDAHGDFNTPETTPSGNIHGMPLAALLGKGSFADSGWANAPRLRERNVALVGLRNLDEREKELVRNSRVTAYTMADIDERGITPVVEEALSIATRGVDGFHVSLDLDWLDPQHAPGVGTPVRGGVTYREAHTAMELVAENRDLLRSMELVEVNPILDDRNETAAMATELAASLLGKRIL